MYTWYVTNLRILFYWWVPDAAFTLLHPSAIVLPRYRASEWAMGNLRTAAEGSYIGKLVKQSLRSTAPKLRQFFQNLLLDNEVPTGAVSRY